MELGLSAADLQQPPAALFRFSGDHPAQSPQDLLQTRSLIYQKPAEQSAPIGLKQLLEAPGESFNHRSKDVAEEQIRLLSVQQGRERIDRSMADAKLFGFQSVEASVVCGRPNRQ